MSVPNQIFLWILLTYMWWVSLQLLNFSISIRLIDSTALPENLPTLSGDFCLYHRYFHHFWYLLLQFSTCLSQLDKEWAPPKVTLLLSTLKSLRPFTSFELHYGTADFFPYLLTYKPINLQCLVSVSTLMVHQPGIARFCIWALCWRQKLSFRISPFRIFFKMRTPTNLEENTKRGDRER